MFLYCCLYFEFQLFLFLCHYKNKIYAKKVETTTTIGISATLHQPVDATEI